MIFVRVNGKLVEFGKHLEEIVSQMTPEEKAAVRKANPVPIQDKQLLGISPRGWIN